MPQSNETLNQYEIVTDETTGRYMIQIANVVDLPEGKCMCRKCNEICDKTDIVTIKNRHGKFTMCKACAESLYEVCPVCNEHVKKTDMEDHVLHGNENVRCCTYCRDQEMQTCDHCGLLHWKNSSNLNSIDGETICSGCLNKLMENGSISICPDCNKYSRNMKDTGIDGKKVCRVCWKNYIPINEYSYKPTPLFKGKGKTFYGFELEVQVPEYTDTESVAVTIRDGKFLYCKHDGSIGHGFEIVSHPFTEEWFYANPGELEKLWTLRERGCDGFHNNQCGMHVHITKEFSHLEIFKMMKLMYNENHFHFWKRVSRRKLPEYERWCDSSSSNKNHNSIVNEAKTKSGNGNKYTAMNMTRNTIECRIFRSTLDKNMFNANMEMMFALTNFVKSGKSLKVSGLEDFKKYIYDSKYGYAKELLTKIAKTKTILTEV